MTTAVCLDLDNLEHRGFEKDHKVPRARAQFNPLAFAEELRDLHITQATVLQNRRFGPVAEQLWRKLGFKVQAVGANCDDEVSKVAMGYAKAGADRIILCAGDADYLQTVRQLKKLGVQVLVWVRRASASRKLISEADGAMYIDRFLIEPPR
jgi:NYN domain-containing protein